ncbi:hypothetical protein FGO68_gene11625 [Halteria grandinella]|uniref:Uncharacterized protein n=1 Tax=Halteria grandinella TaxID=5974 RepID=A0A8J8T1R9_HALGN|nr:hypothetical protein FGO68_gene11625 [Halteria grandinella]
MKKETFLTKVSAIINKEQYRISKPGLKIARKVITVSCSVIFLGELLHRFDFTIQRAILQSNSLVSTVQYVMYELGLSRLSSSLIVDKDPIPYQLKFFADLLQMELIYLHRSGMHYCHNFITGTNFIHAQVQMRPIDIERLYFSKSYLKSSLCNLQKLSLCLKNASALSDFITCKQAKQEFSSLLNVKKGTDQKLSEFKQLLMLVRVKVIAYPGLILDDLTIFTELFIDQAEASAASIIPVLFKLMKKATNNCMLSGEFKLFDMIIPNCDELDYNMQCYADFKEQIKIGAMFTQKMEPTVEDVCSSSYIVLAFFIRPITFKERLLDNINQLSKVKGSSIPFMSMLARCNEGEKLLKNMCKIPDVVLRKILVETLALDYVGKLPDLGLNLKREYFEACQTLLFYNQRVLAHTLRPQVPKKIEQQAEIEEQPSIDDFLFEKAAEINENEDLQDAIAKSVKDQK